MKLRFITGNHGKVEEAKARLGPLGIDVVAEPRELAEIQADTIREVAQDKAQRLVGQVASPFFLEDAGLHVDALGGFPGAYSRYVFETLGCDGLLRLVGSRRDRTARFVAVIAYVDATNRIHLFEGQARGSIVRAARGTGGFGFDPIFRPDHGRRTFAELAPEEKGAVSHRGAALDGLARFLGRAGLRARTEP